MIDIDYFLYSNIAWFITVHIILERALILAPLILAHQPERRALHVRQLMHVLVEQLVHLV